MILNSTSPIIKTKFEEFQPEQPVLSLTSERQKPKLFYGWIIVLAGFIVTGSTWGMQYSFGIFFKPMLAEFGWSRAATSGAFSTCMAVIAFSSLLMGWLCDRYGPRITIALSGTLISLGTFLTSQVSSLWQLYLFYGIIIGTGMGASFVPLMATISRWFEEKRGLASGIVAAGIGGGTLLIAPLARYSIDLVGWRMSYHIFGISLFVTIVGASMFLRAKPQDVGLLPFGTNGKSLRVVPTTDAQDDFTLKEAFKTGTFWMIFFAQMFWTFGLFIPMIHVVAYATDLGISPMAAAAIISIIGASSLIGKIVSGGISDKIGQKNTLLVSLAIQAFTMFWLMGSSNLYMFYPFAFLFGFSYGGVVPQFPVMTGKFFGLKYLGVIFGLINSGALLGNATGPAIAGYIFDVSQSYKTAFLLAGLSVIISISICMFFKKPHSDGYYHHRLR